MAFHAEVLMGVVPGEHAGEEDANDAGELDGRTKQAGNVGQEQIHAHFIDGMPQVHVLEEKGRKHPEEETHGHRAKEDDEEIKHGKALCVWMGGGGRGGSNELLDSIGGWVGGWVGGTYHGGSGEFGADE